MNTPEPCCKCSNLYSNVLYEEDPSYMSECLLGKKMGDLRCKHFKKSDSMREEKLRNISMGE